MVLLQSYEIATLKVVSKYGPCGEKLIHENSENECMNDTRMGLGELNNRGYAIHLNKQWQMTEKGTEFLKELAANDDKGEPLCNSTAKVYGIVEKHEPILLEDITKMSELGNEQLVMDLLAKLMQQDKVIEANGYFSLNPPTKQNLEKLNVVVNQKSELTVYAGVDDALNNLEKQLRVKPVDLVPVSNYEQKVAVLDKLSLLLDPSIANVIDDIKADVTELFNKAA